MISFTKDKNPNFIISNHLISQNTESNQDYIQNDSHLEFPQILDNYGVILEPEKFSSLPNLDEQQQKILSLLLNSSLVFCIQGASTSCTLSEFLNHLHHEHAKMIDNIYIKGGFVRRLLLSKDFLSSMFESMGILKETIELFLEKQSLLSTEGSLSDIDICFKMNAQGGAKKLTQSVWDFFSIRCQEKDYEKLKKGFLKFCAPLNGKYTIASFGKLNVSSVCNHSQNFSEISSEQKKQSITVEILGVEEIPRDYLFVSDAVIIDITNSIRGKEKNPFCLKSFYQNGHQTILDLIHKVIRIKDPKTIDETGFPALLSYYSKNFTAQGEIEILLETFIKAKEPEKKFFNYFKNHHENNPDFWVAMLFHLRQHPNTTSIFEFIKNQIDNEPIKPSMPFSKLYKFLSAKKFSSDSLNAILILGALFLIGRERSSVCFKTHEKKPYVQFKLSQNGPTLFLPFTPIESFQHLIDLFEKEENIEIINIAKELFQQILFKAGGVNHDHSFMFKDSSKLIKMFKEQMSSSHPTLLYFSYHLFLNLYPIHQEKELLFQYLPEVIQHATNIWRPILIKYLSSIFPEGLYKDLLIQIDDKTLENPKDFLRQWILLLFKCSEPQFFRLIALRKDLEKHLPEDFSLIFSFLKSASWMLSKEQEEKMLLNIFFAIPSFTSNVQLRTLFTLVVNFLHKVKQTKKKCSKEFEHAFEELVKVAFKQKEIAWGKILLEKASSLKMGPLGKKKINHNSLIQISEILFENEENQKAIDPFLVILAPTTKQKDKDDLNITFWIKKRLQYLTTEKEVSKLSIRLLNLSSKRLLEKETHDYAFHFYEIACDTQQKEMAFDLLKKLTKNSFCSFSNTIFLKNTKNLLQDLFVEKQQSCFDFIKTLLPEKANFVVSLFPSFCSLLSREQEEKIITAIFQAIPFWPSTESMRPIFFIAKNFLGKFENSKNLFTKEFQESFNNLIETAFKENEIHWGKDLLKQAIPLNFGPTTQKNKKNFDCLMRICETLFENKTKQEEVDRFLILLSPNQLETIEDRKKITHWVQARLQARKKEKKLSKLDTKLLKAAENWFSEQQIYDQTLLFYEKSYGQQEYLTAVELLKNLLKNRFCILNNQILIKTTNALFDDLFIKVHRKQNKSKNEISSSIEIQIPSLIEFIFQQQKVEELMNFSFLSKHTLKILKIVKASLNLSPEIRENIAESLLTLKPNHSSQVELTLLESISQIQNKKTKPFYNRLKELSLNLLLEVGQETNLEKALKQFNCPKESEKQFWIQAYLATLSNIGNPKKLDLITTVFSQVVIENSFFANNFDLFCNCWIAIIKAHRKIKHYPPILLEQASKQLCSNDNISNRQKLDEILVTYLLESDVDKYFESIVKAISQIQASSPENILLLLKKGYKHKTTWGSIGNFLDFALSNQNFLDHVNPDTFYNVLIKYNFKPFFEKIATFLIESCEKINHKEFSNSSLKLSYLFIERFLKDNYPINEFLKNQGFSKLLSREHYTPFSVDLFMTGLFKEYLATEKLGNYLKNLLTIFKQNSLNIELFEKWSFTTSQCLLKVLATNIQNWETFILKVEEVQKTIDEKTLEFAKSLTSKTGSSTEISLKNPNTINLDQYLFMRHLLNALLDQKYQNDQPELNDHILKFFKKNFPIWRHVKSKERRVLTTLLEKLLFWIPYAVKEPEKKTLNFYNQTIQELYFSAFECDYFQENIDHLSSFYFAYNLHTPELLDVKDKKTVVKSFFNYVSNVTKDNNTEALQHCFKLIEKIPFLEDFADLNSDVHSIFITRCFNEPLILDGKRPFYMDFMLYLLKKGADSLIQNKNNKKINLFLFINHLIHHASPYFKNLSLSENNAEQTVFLGIALIQSVVKFIESFSEEQEKYHEILDEFLDILMPAIKSINEGVNENSTFQLQSHQVFALNLLTPFSKEKPHLKERREKRYQEFLEFLNTIFKAPFDQIVK